MAPRTFFAGMLLAAGLGTCLFFAAKAYRRSVISSFLKSLPEVSCTPTLVIGMTVDETKQVEKFIREREIDLFQTYVDFPPKRVNIAWILIEQESEEYHDFVNSHPDEVSECESRIWQVRTNGATPFADHDQSTSAGYRAKLFNLILNSPTASSRLATGRWFQKQGRDPQAIAAYRSALNSETVPEARLAAVELVEFYPQQTEAEDFLLKLLRDEEQFYADGAGALVRRYGGGTNLGDLLNQLDDGNPNSLLRQQFVDALDAAIQLSRKQ